MKWLFLAVSLLGITLLSNSQTSDVPLACKQAQICGPSVAERIRNYLDSEEIKPTHVINNTDDRGAWISKISTIKIGDHTIEWIDKVGKLDFESSLKINGELITLKDKRSINAADGDRPIDFLVVGEWDQIKLYKLYEGDLIGISMNPRMCTGLMCGVAAQLMYDVKTKKTTYFGTFRTDHETRLFRITNKNDYYYVAKNFNGDPHGLTVPRVIAYELYKLEKSGRFVIQKNPAGERYFIKHTTFPDLEFKGDEVVPKKELTADRLEQNWIEKIDYRLVEQIRRSRHTKLRQAFRPARLDLGTRNAALDLFATPFSEDIYLWSYQRYRWKIGVISPRVAGKNSKSRHSRMGPDIEIRYWRCFCTATATVL